jgi:hypothetical protein
MNKMLSDLKVVSWFESQKWKMYVNEAREHYNYVNKCKKEEKKKQELSNELMKGYMEMYKK